MAREPRSATSHSAPGSHAGRIAAPLQSLPCPARQAGADRTSQAVADGQQLRAHAAVPGETPPGSFPASRTQPDEPSAPLFLPRRLDAMRRALRKVASIMTVRASRPSEAGPSMIRAKVPIRRQQWQRLFYGPCSAGVSRQRKPLRLKKVIPLSTRRSSPLGVRATWDAWRIGKRTDPVHLVRQAFDPPDQVLLRLTQSARTGLSSSTSRGALESR